MTDTKKNYAIKKVQIAIDKLVDLHDLGFTNDKIRQCLDLLQSLETEIQTD